MKQEPDILFRAIEFARIGLAELDSEGRFLAASPAYLSMLGFQETELLGQHWRATVHPDDHGKVHNAYHLARTTGHSRIELRVSLRDSTTVYQSLTITPTNDCRGVLSGYYCLSSDISGYKREQEAWMLAAESSPHALLMADAASGRIQSANSASEALFGYTREELAGCPIEVLMPERFRCPHQAHRAAFHNNGSMKRMGLDQCGLRKDGVEIPIHVHLNRIKVQAGELIMCTIIDMAEEVQHRKQLEFAKQTAEAANRAKSDFLARMSHEIRTPMNLIMGMNALLLESPLNVKQQQQVEISYRNVRRLLRLINGILDLSKVEAGKLTLEAVPFDLNEVIKECAATMSSAIERNGLEFEISVDPDVWRYWIGDAERLQQVLLNLIGNSVKFTEHGKIEVRVLTEYRRTDENRLRFEVTDTGCGVPSDKSEVIFEAFSQAEGSMDRPYEGTGLGLAIAKTLVEMMGGTIWLEKKLGPGAKFVFTAVFPTSTEDMVRDKRSLAASAAAVRSLPSGTRILIVEDNPENTILVRAYLENLSLVLDYASNGVEAVESRKQGSYDLVLMDIQMPVMDGYTATREIRAWENEYGLAPVPIVALTAHALRGAFAESLEAGCNGHVTKPLNRNELLEAIAKFAKHPVPQIGAIPEKIAALRQTFLSNRWLDLAKMRDGFAAGDFAGIQTIGHNCKGIGTGYGFPAITDLGSAIEQAAKAFNTGELSESIQQFECCLRASQHGP